MPVSQIDFPEIKLGVTFDCPCGRTHRVPTRRILFGDSLNELLSSIPDDEIPSGDILIVSGPKTRLIAGEGVAEHFHKRGRRTVVLEVERADLATVSKVERAASACSLAVAVGGGNAIDACKYSAHRLGIPFISIPTTISHDGVASPVASISLGSKRTSLMTAPPILVAITEPLIKHSPKRLIASGCADILAKSTSLRDWLLGHIVKDEHICRATFGLVASALLEIRRFIEDGGGDFILLSSAAVRCGLAMTLIGSSRPCSGAEHLFSHYIDGVGEGIGLHGEQVGMGAVLMAMRYEEFDILPPRGVELTGAEIRNYLAKAGAPTSINDIQVSKETAIRALLECKEIRPERYTILHHAPLTHRGAANLLRKAGMLSDE
ncbi:MAG: iron-containing alcohol dehydrogenase [Nitrososphaerota archaeon]|nr:iron-containing alcohol dehydrogenase [Candidatus Calditenuaceae archaeon]MDW8073063.1 iron-containing alcohol dehydrogenase [Nitrososphaerota archaeon]